MVTKRTEFKGSTVQDRLAPTSNFLCNDEDNLLFTPPADTENVLGEANNRFIISEYIAPVWSKVTVNYKKTAVYGHHDGTIEVYGLDQLGTESLLYQAKIDQTETGVQNFQQIDMLKSACTSAVYSLDDETEETIDRSVISLDMPKLRESYDDVSLKASWYNPTSYPYRKGIAVNLPWNRRHAQLMGTADYGKDDAFSAPTALMDNYWYAVVKVEYTAHMQTDFGDLKFCGFDGVTPIEHWIYSKSDSTYAYCMLRIPWYFGYYENETIKTHTTYQSNYGQGDYKGSKKWTNPDVKFIWMYYGNSTDSNSTTPVAGTNGYKEFDDFTTDTSSSWTKLGTGANASVTWDASSSLDLQINANNTGAVGAYKSLPSSCWDSKGNPSYDIIWKMENIPTTAGNYDGGVYVGTTPTVANAFPDNGVGLWITDTHVFAYKFESGVATGYTTGTQLFNHDDTEPLYIRLRVHKTHQSAGAGSVSWWISENGKDWHYVINLIYRTDFTVDPALWTKHGLRVGSWAAAPAFNMELDCDWYMITESHELPKRRFNISHFDYTDVSYNDAGYGTDASATIATPGNGTIDFAITGGAQYWDGGSATAPMLIQNQYATEDGLVFEAKLTEVTRTGGGVIRAGISLHTDANKHIDCQYQLYSSASFNREMRGNVVYGGVNYQKHEESYERQAAISTTVPMYMRIIPNTKLNHHMVQYSRDGWNWITTYVDAIYPNLSDFNQADLWLANDAGVGTGTAKFDYWHVTHAAYIADLGGYLAFTSEQAWTDWDDIQPYSDTSWTNWYTDGFEDNAYSGRSYPYRNYTVGGVGSLSVFSNSLGADVLADNQGQFETGVGGLTAGNCTITQSSTVAQNGTYSAKMVGTAQDSYGAPGGDFAAGTFRLSFAANQTWYLHGWVYPTSSNHIEDVSYYRACRAVVFYNDSGGTGREVQSQGALTLNAWNEVKFRFVIPSGATAAALRLYNGVNGGTCYWDNVTLQQNNKPISDSYSLRSTSTTATDSANAITLFENPHTGYTATFKFAPYYDGRGSSGDMYNRLWLLRATDEYSYTGIDMVSGGANVNLRVVDYTVGTGSALTTVNWRSAAQFIPQKEYEVTVIDSGTHVTVYIDGTKWIDNYYYGAGNYVSRKYPGIYTGFGCNRLSRALWDDITIKPGYWYGGVQYTSPALTTAVTSTLPVSRTWQPIYDPETRYKFIMPTGYVRNQPMIVQWKDQGADSYQYSKRFHPRMGGVFRVGPNGLDKYIGMRTRILFEGDDDDDFQVDQITYEYEV